MQGSHCKVEVAEGHATCEVKAEDAGRWNTYDVLEQSRGGKGKEEKRRSNSNHMQVSFGSPKNLQLDLVASFSIPKGLESGIEQ